MDSLEYFIIMTASLLLLSVMPALFPVLVLFLNPVNLFKGSVKVFSFMVSRVVDVLLICILFVFVALDFFICSIYILIMLLCLLKGAFKKVWDWFWREIKIFVHNYFLLAVIAFVLSQKYLFNDAFVFYVDHLHFAVVFLVFVALLFGRRGAFQTSTICLGFLASMAYYGRIDLIHCFVNTSSDNFFKTYFCDFIVCVLVLILPPLVKIVSDKIYKPSIGMTKDKLYPDRKIVFDKILRYLQMYRVIAIDSPYGNGKSAIVEALKNEKKDWNFITFGVLSTTVDNIEFCVVREINAVLESKGVYLNPISKIKSFFCRDFMYCVGDFLFDNPQSYEKQMIDFVKGVQMLKEVIVLNFEDIDRIKDTNLINKIFSICDTLLKYESYYDKKYIKVIYQCNKNVVNDLFGDMDKNKRYADKFILHSISLDVLPGEFFKNVLKQNSEKYHKIKNIRFEFLSQEYDYKLFNVTISFEFNGYTIRGVEQILDKTNAAFEMFDDISPDNELDVQTVLVFFVTMYFMPDVFNKLKRKEGLHEQKLFCYFNQEQEEKMYSLDSVRHDVRISKLMGQTAHYFDAMQNKKYKENRNALMFLLWLGCNENFFECLDATNLDASRDGKIIDDMSRREFVFDKLLSLHK